MSEPIVYDGRRSEQCKTECQAGTCRQTSYGCGGCCGCLGGCELGYEEQLAEASGGSSAVSEETPQ